MSIEKVETLVLRKAREEADSLLAQAQEDACKKLARTEQKLKQSTEEELERFRRQLQEESDRQLASRTTEHRRELLAERNRILNEVRLRARELVAKREQPQYRNWLAAQLRQLGDVPEGKIHCRADDRAIVEELLDELAREGVKLKLSLSDEELQTAGGLVVSCPEYDLDMTLESRLESLWQESLPAVIEQLGGLGRRSEA